MESGAASLTRQLVRAELGESFGHFRQAATHAAGGVGATVGPRVQAARVYLSPTATRVAQTAANGWGSTMTMIAPLAVAALAGAREAGTAAGQTGSRTMHGVEEEDESDAEEQAEVDEVQPAVVDADRVARGRRRGRGRGRGRHAPPAARTVGDVRPGARGGDRPRRWSGLHQRRQAQRCWRRRCGPGRGRADGERVEAEAGHHRQGPGPDGGSRREGRQHDRGYRPTVPDRRLAKAGAKPDGLLGTGGNSARNSRG